MGTQDQHVSNGFRTTFSPMVHNAFQQARNNEGGLNNEPMNDTFGKKGHKLAAEL